jgi:RecB family exonuclease
LQKFSVCPYQFLLSAIYRLQPAEEPEPLQKLDPLTRGALFHEVQADFLRALKEHGQLPVSERNLGTALATLDRIVEHVADKYHERLAPAIERVWDDETALMQGDLRVWLAALATSSAEWIPRYFELSFGLPIDHAHDPASRRQPVAIDGRFPMRGAIDLVEQHGAAGWLRVTDHKTGKNRTTRGLVVGGGSTLQPIIYTLVAEQMLGLPVHASRLSFCTTAGGFSEHPVSVRDEYRRFGVEVLEIIDRAVEHGALPQAPRKGACGWCDFKAVCGPHEERRAAHKRPDLPALEDLQALRGLP